jgi:hypothetical protein
MPGQPGTLTEGPRATWSSQDHAANGRTIATRNGIDGILSTSQAPATIPRFVLPATVCRYDDQFATLLTTLLTRNPELGHRVQNSGAP